MTDLRAKRRQEFEAEIRRTRAVWALVFSVLLWVDALLFFADSALALLGMGEGPYNESVEAELLFAFYLGPFHIGLVVLWAVFLRRSWRFGIAGLPPALLIAGMVCFPLIASLSSS